MKFIYKLDFRESIQFLKSYIIHRTKLLWYRLRTGKPWPLYDCYYDKMEEDLDNVPELDSFFMLYMTKQQYDNLPADIAIRDCWMPYLYTTSPVVADRPEYDGTQEETTEEGGTGGSGTDPGDELDVYTPEFAEGEMVAFFEAPSDGSYSNVSVWCWNDAMNFTGGTWPGQRAQLMGVTAEGGNKIWKWTYSGTMDPDNMPTGIIFNNTSSPQTAELEFKNGGYYTVGGLQRVIAPGTSGVDALSSDAFRVYAQGGAIYAVSDCPCIVQVVSVNGRKVKVR